MSWNECDQMSLRREFVCLASVEGSNISELCRRFGISRKTGYKWLKRYRAEGDSGLADRSRRPLRFRFRSQTFKVSEAFGGQPVGLCLTLDEDLWNIFFCSHKIGEQDLSVVERK